MQGEEPLWLGITSKFLRPNSSANINKVIWKVSAGKIRKSLIITEVQVLGTIYKMENGSYFC
jgi:hypothetical protein